MHIPEGVIVAVLTPLEDNRNITFKSYQTQEENSASKASRPQDLQKMIADITKRIVGEN